MTVDISTDDLPAPMGERHVLQPMEELRVEVAFGTSHTQICLQKGSCELWGCELALQKVYSIANGGLKLALFSWHGCVVDVEAEDIDISYVSDETDANIAYVNTHAQLEALRDEAALNNTQGPRVMIVGPPESGKSSLAQTLIGYATKVGRTPLWVDLDPLDNALSVPGALAVAPMNRSAVQVEQYANKCGIPPTDTSVHPLVFWHGTQGKLHPDLFRAQVEKISKCIQKRFDHCDNTRYSGMIVNTNGWIQDEGYKLLLHAADALDISIVLILGHDRLYSMMTNHNKKNPPPVPRKVLKLPRSGGVVSRPDTFVRHARSRAVKRYFYGDLVDPPKTSETTTSTSSSTATKKVPQLTPFLVQLNFSEVEIYKLSSMALSSSLLPVAQQQSTDAIQIAKLDLELQAESLLHQVVAVCHPSAVAAYQASGTARDLVCSGVAGFCAVERVLTDSDTLHLLSPCAGSLPSKTLLVGDITWME